MTSRFSRFASAFVSTIPENALLGGVLGAAVGTASNVYESQTRKTGDPIGTTHKPESFYLNEMVLQEAAKGAVAVAFWPMILVGYVSLGVGVGLAWRKLAQDDEAGDSDQH